MDRLRYYPAIQNVNSRQAVPRRNLSPSTIASIPSEPGVNAKIRDLEVQETSSCGSSHVGNKRRESLPFPFHPVDELRLREQDPMDQHAYNYAEAMHRNWRMAERHLSGTCFVLNFQEDSAAEKFRNLCLLSVLEYAAATGLSIGTFQFAILTMNRMFIEKYGSAHDEKHDITYFEFLVVVYTALRYAIKSEEPYYLSQPVLANYDLIWKYGRYNDRTFSVPTAFDFNDCESQCWASLREPSFPATPTQYIVRYMDVGGWQDDEQTMEFALYLSTILHFGTVDMEILNEHGYSGIAAACVALSKKTTLTMAKNEQETINYWPSSLERYTGYSKGSLRPIMKILTSLIRHKPECVVKARKGLKYFFPTWADTNWK